MNNRTNQRQVGRVAIAMLLLVLIFSVVGAVSAGAGCLYLTPGNAAGSSAVTAWRAPEVALTSGEGAIAIVIAGAGGFVSTGSSCLEEPAEYAGELVVGPNEFAP